jgi:MFS family permease
MNLCFPFASVYMLALGLSDSQVGLVATVFMVSQVLFAFLSGPITDKMGRRKATAVYDFIGWSIPCLIWWRAEGFWFFFIAALLNGAMKVTTNSWECLLVEDAEKSQITRLYSLVVACGQLCGLFAPISSILVSRLTLVPAIRILYINAFIVMTIKIFVLFAFSRETGRGMIRIEETRGKSVFSLVAGYGGILRLVAKSPGTLFALAVSILVSVVGMINTTFWQVIVNKKLLVPDSLLPLFAALRSVVAIVFLFLLAPRLSKGLLKLPLLTGFACYFVGQTLLILAPVEGLLKYTVLCVSLVFDGFGSGALLMLAGSLVALNANPEERARVMAIVHMIIMAFSSPFGWIGGMLSDISRNLPFALNLVLLGSGAAMTLVHYRRHDEYDSLERLKEDS